MEIWKSWPQWLVDAIVSAYRSGKTPEEIGAVIGRRAGVVRHKLVREGVYMSVTMKKQMQCAEASEGF